MQPRIISGTPQLTFRMLVKSGSSLDFLCKFKFPASDSSFNFKIVFDVPQLRDPPVQTGEQVIAIGTQVPRTRDPSYF